MPPKTTHSGSDVSKNLCDYGICGVKIQQKKSSPLMNGDERRWKRISCPQGAGLSRTAQNTNFNQENGNELLEKTADYRSRQL